MARPSNTDERRMEIVRGLRDVMPRHGFRGASIQRIADAAGLNAGLVHYHFRNKQEILVELVGTMAKDLMARYERFAATAQDPTERIEAFIDAHVALGDDVDADAVACWVSIAAEAVLQPEVQRVYRRAVEASQQILEWLIVEALTRGARNEVADPIDPSPDLRLRAQTMASTLMSAIHGAYQLSVTVPSVLPVGFAAPAFKGMAAEMIATALSATRPLGGTP